MARSGMWRSPITRTRRDVIVVWVARWPGGGGCECGVSCGIVCVVEEDCMYGRREGVGLKWW